MFENSFSKPEAVGSKETEQTVSGFLEQSFRKLESLELVDRQDKFYKEGILESMKDIAAIFEGGEATGENLLIAYRGLEEIEKNYPLKEDVGIDCLKETLAKKIKKGEGYEIGVVEDMDKVLEENKNDAMSALGAVSDWENPSLEQLERYKIALENYSRAKREMEIKQRQIMGSGKKFYGGLAEKIAGVIEQKASRLKLLKGFVSSPAMSKAARVVAVGIMVTGALLSAERNFAEAADAGDEEREIGDNGGGISAEETPTVAEQPFAEQPSEEEEKAAIGSFEEAQRAVKNYIKELNVFSQISLMGEIKEKADSLEKFITDGGGAIYEEASDKLRKVLEIYGDNLAELKAKYPDIYQQKSAEVVKLIKTIKDSNLNELKNKFI